MSRTSVKRKVVSWESYTPPIEWTPKLECGHGYADYDGLGDEAKVDIENNGNTVECYECGQEKDRIVELESELKQLKSRRKRTA